MIEGCQLFAQGDQLFLGFPFYFGVNAVPFIGNLPPCDASQLLFQRAASVVWFCEDRLSFRRKNAHCTFPGIRQGGCLDFRDAPPHIRSGSLPCLLFFLPGGKLTNS